MTQQVNDQPQDIKVIIQEQPRPSGPVKRFDVDSAYAEIKAAVDKKLERKIYETDEAAKMCKELADDIRNKVKSMSTQMQIPRYKIFAVVTIFSQKGQGLRQCSRCYYDPETDYEVSYIFQNDNLICVATVYAIYYY